MDPAANLVGPGCAGYAEAVPDGAGSIEGMAAGPGRRRRVEQPAPHDPHRRGQRPAQPRRRPRRHAQRRRVHRLRAGRRRVREDRPRHHRGAQDRHRHAESILTYHVVPGQIAPADIAGTHTTVQGADLEVTGSGDELMVNDANVICGGVQTANATVYLIDTVLMPPAQ